MARVTISSDGFAVAQLGTVSWRDIDWVDGAKYDRLTYEELFLTFYCSGKSPVFVGDLDEGFYVLEGELASRLPGFDMGWRTQLERHAAGRVFQLWNRQFERPSPAGAIAVVTGANELAAEIDRIFPYVDMPERGAFPIGETDWEIEALLDEVDTWRGKAITSRLIYYLHQEWYQLSAKAWRWMLPHWLRFCLTPKAAHDGMAIEWLVYSLRPGEAWADRTRKQLGLLSAPQIECLIHFLEWLSRHPRFGDYFPEDIAQAILFLQSLNGA